MSPETPIPTAGPEAPETEGRLRALPKVELHQHVDGSIPAEVTWDLMHHYRLHPAPSLDEMRRFLEVQAGEEGTLLAYLDKTGGFELGAGPTLTVVDEGFAKTITTTAARSDVYAFAYAAEGLMGGMGLKGSKITRYHPE